MPPLSISNADAATLAAADVLLDQILSYGVVNGVTMVLPPLPNFLDPRLTPEVRALARAPFVAATLAMVHLAGQAGRVWQDLTATLANGWVTGDDGVRFGPAVSLDSFGVVRLRGAIQDGTVPATAFTLAAGRRPTRELRFICASGGGGVGQLRITPAGLGIVEGPYVDFVSLDGISFTT